MAFMPSSSFDRGNGYPFDPLGEDLTNYRPRVSGMRQIFGTLDFSNYPNTGYVSAAGYSQPYALDSFHSRSCNDIGNPLYGLSSSQVPSRACFETYQDVRREISSPPPATHNSHCTYSAIPSLSPPISGLAFEGNATEVRAGTTVRVTNQARTNSINRGGSIRREAPADKICEYCGTGFTRNERLRYHIERVHLKAEPEHACELPGCSRVFRQRSDLLRHLRKVHKDTYQSGM